MAFIPLEKLHQLHDGYRRSFRVAGEELLLIVENGTHYLIKAQCPHLGMSLARATLAADGLRCPGHGIVFSLDTGFALNAGDCPDRLQFVPIAYEGSTLGVYQD